MLVPVLILMKSSKKPMRPQRTVTSSTGSTRENPSRTPIREARSHPSSRNTPPTVGVPAFFWWEGGPSWRSDWRKSMRLRKRITAGPGMAVNRNPSSTARSSLCTEAICSLP